MQVAATLWTFKLRLQLVADKDCAFRVVDGSDSRDWRVLKRATRSTFKPATLARSCLETDFPDANAATIKSKRLAMTS